MLEIQWNPKNVIVHNRKENIFDKKDKHNRSEGNFAKFVNKLSLLFKSFSLLN